MLKSLSKTRKQRRLVLRRCVCVLCVWVGSFGSEDLASPFGEDRGFREVRCASPVFEGGEFLALCRVVSRVWLSSIGCSLYTLTAIHFAVVQHSTGPSPVVSCVGILNPIGIECGHRSVVCWWWCGAGGRGVCRVQTASIVSEWCECTRLVW